MTPSPEVLAATHAAAFTQQRPWSASEFAALLTSPRLILCGDARSFIIGRVVADEAEVLTVATRPQDQRQGLASACLAQFLIAAGAARADRAFLDVAADNQAGKRLYFNHDFQEVGRRPGYYGRANGAKVDAILMQRLL